MTNKIPDSNKYSFLELISSFEKIEVPILQRDYVQGRLNDEVTEIRENLVNDLLEHISVERETILPLDFIYGYAENELGKYDREISKKNIENLLETISIHSSLNKFKINYSLLDDFVSDNNVFIPLDGQQRLTTLFLLHFYILLKFKPSQLSLLNSKLTYKTRKTSEQFCEKLLQNASNLNPGFKITKAIEDSSWFLKSWKKDPTVKGMLTMLKEIENKFESYPDLQTRLDFSYQNLFIEPKIFFDFLNLSKKSLSDEIYLKMNSTGKSLSDYDNFKSWLTTEVKLLLRDNKSEQNLDCFKNWQNKLDQEWYNVFWSLDPVNADKLIYNFIKSNLSFSLLTQVENVNQDEKLLKIQFDKLNSDSFVTHRFFKENNLITISNITRLFKLFDELADETSEILTIVSQIWNSTFSTDNIFKYEFINQRNDLSLIHKAFLYSIVLLIENKEHLSIMHIKKWARIFRNVIYNTTIDDFSRFIPAIIALEEFKVNNSNFTIDVEKWIEFFNDKQIKEEFTKFQFIDNSVLCEFHKAEDHHYLYGQIGFLIIWSKNDKQEFDFDLFKLSRERLFNLFSKNNLSSENYPIQVTLLSYDDKWMPDKNSNRYSFCKNTYSSSRERNENWRILFNKKESEIFKLITLSPCNDENLKDIIVSNLLKIKDWRTFIIENPSLIAKCGERLINWLSEGNFVRLMDKTKINGAHTELRTWVLYTNIKSTFKLDDTTIRYQYENSNDKDCRIRFILEDVYIKFNRVSNKLAFEVYNYSTEQYEDIVHPINLKNQYLDVINSFNLNIK